MLANCIFLIWSGSLEQKNEWLNWIIYLSLPMWVGFALFPIFPRAFELLGIGTGKMFAVVFWLIGIGLLVAVLTWLGGIVTGMSVSAAIVLGAIIVAYAVSSRS